MVLLHSSISAPPGRHTETEGTHRWIPPTCLLSVLIEICTQTTETFDCLRQMPRTPCKRLACAGIVRTNAFFDPAENARRKNAPSMSGRAWEARPSQWERLQPAEGSARDPPGRRPRLRRRAGPAPAKRRVSARTSAYNRRCRATSPRIPRCNTSWKDPRRCSNRTHSRRPRRPRQSST